MLLTVRWPKHVSTVIAWACLQYRPKEFTSQHKTHFVGSLSSLEFHTTSQSKSKYTLSAILGQLREQRCCKREAGIAQISDSSCHKRTRYEDSEVHVPERSVNIKILDALFVESFATADHRSHNGSVAHSCDHGFQLLRWQGKQWMWWHCILAANQITWQTI